MAVLRSGSNYRENTWLRLTSQVPSDSRALKRDLGFERSQRRRSRANNNLKKLTKIVAQNSSSCFFSSQGRFPDRGQQDLICSADYSRSRRLPAGDLSETRPLGVYLDFGHPCSNRGHNAVVSALWWFTHLCCFFFIKLEIGRDECWPPGVKGRAISR